MNEINFFLSSEFRVPSFEFQVSSYIFYKPSWETVIQRKTHVITSSARKSHAGGEVKKRCYFCRVIFETLVSHYEQNANYKQKL